MPSLLQVRGVSAGYGPVSVIHDVHMDVDAGEVVALVGPNGAGKTTTLNAIGGYVKTFGGEITFAGASMPSAPHRRARQGLAFVNESRSVLRTLSTRENLKLARVDTKKYLALFPELAGRLDVKAGDLSGGEQQMLAVGRALVREPHVFMADELSLGLAPLATERLLQAVRAAADQDGIGVLLVEQHLNNVLRFADRVYLMVSGRVESEGTAEELASSRSSVAQAYFGYTPETQVHQGE